MAVPTRFEWLNEVLGRYEGAMLRVIHESSTKVSIRNPYEEGSELDIVYPGDEVMRYCESFESDRLVGWEVLAQHVPSYVDSWLMRRFSLAPHARATVD